MKIIKKYKENYILIRRTIISLNTINYLLKIVLAVIAKSLLLFIYSFYNISINLAKRTSLREHINYKYENYYFCGIIVLISSIVYIIYSNYIYVYGSNIKYSMYTGIGIATLAFYNITIAIIGIVKAKKDKNLTMETIKLTNLASSLISMSLTQTAILSFTNAEDMSRYNGIGGIFFGILSMIIGIYMIIYTIKVKSSEK